MDRRAVVAAGAALARRGAATGLVLLLGAASALAQPVILVSKGQPAGTGGNQPSFTTNVPRNTISADGRFMVFLSLASNLVPGQVDPNSRPDVFFYDGSAVRLVSHNASDDKTAGNIGSCKQPVISLDGRWVAFACEAQNLVDNQNDFGGLDFDVFLWDRDEVDPKKSTKLVSHIPGSPEVAADLPSERPVISGTGAFVAYESRASNLVPSFLEKNGGQDVFWYDRVADTNRLVSHNTDPAQLTTGIGISFEPVISTSAAPFEGRFVAFTSLGTDMSVGADRNGANPDVFSWDATDGSIKVVSRDNANLDDTSNGASGGPSITDGGTWIAFESTATNLVSGQIDINTTEDVFLFQQTREVQLVSHVQSQAFRTPNPGRSRRAFVSATEAAGVFVAYESDARNLLNSFTDVNGLGQDVFYWDRQQTTALQNRLVSHRPGAPDTTGSQAASDPQISGKGERVAYVSQSTDLAASQIDSNNKDDVFVWDAGFDTSMVASRARGTSTRAGNEASGAPALSLTGGMVAFQSKSADLYFPDFNGGIQDAFLLQVEFVNLRITKTGSPSPARPGGSFQYTIIATNPTGPSAVGALVSDPLPVNLINPTWTCVPTGGATCTPSGAGNINDLVNLPPGSTVTYTVTATLPLVPTAGSFINIAQVQPPPDLVEAVPGDNSAQDIATLVPEAVLTLNHGDAPDPVVVGGTFSYTTTILNTGPSRADVVNLTINNAGGTIVSVDNPSCTFTITFVNCPNLGNLNPFAAITVTTLVTAPLGPVVLNSIAQADSTTSSAPVQDSEQTTVISASSSVIRFFTATSKKNQNSLEWLTPSIGPYVKTKIRYRSDGTCPASPDDVADPPPTTITLAIPTNPPVNAKGKVDHLGLANGTVYCYAAYVDTTGADTTFGPPKFVKGRPMDNAVLPELPIKWAFSTGATAVTPPTIGAVAVLAPSNDNSLYAMLRGASGGTWPEFGPGPADDFWPFMFPQPVQSRSPIIPLNLSPGPPSASAMLLGSQNGQVFSVDSNQGGHFAPSPLWSSPTIAPAAYQGAPAAMFTGFGGTTNVVLVGSRVAGVNSFYGRNHLSGAPLWTYSPAALPGPIGAINSGAAVDYPSNRVFFTSRQGGAGASTVWALTVAGGLAWSYPFGDVDASPVVRQRPFTLFPKRVYVGNNAGQILAFDANALGPIGTAAWGGPFASGATIRGFVFPDRLSDDLYFTNALGVWKIRDNDLAAGLMWGPVPIPSPSIPVFGRLGVIAYVWVGSSDGQLYQIDAVTGGNIKSVLLGGGGSVVGAPSLDTVNGFIYVGSSSGVIYAVQVPLP